MKLNTDSFQVPAKTVPKRRTHESFYAANGTSLVYVEALGSHFVVDKFWYEYMLMRVCAPKLVINCSTLRELKATLRTRGITL